MATKTNLRQLTQNPQKVAQNQQLDFDRHQSCEVAEEFSDSDDQINACDFSYAERLQDERKPKEMFVNNHSGLQLTRHGTAYKLVSSSLDISPGKNLDKSYTKSQHLFLRSRTVLSTSEQKRPLSTLLRPENNTKRQKREKQPRTDKLGNQITKHGKKHKITFRDEMPIVQQVAPNQDLQQGSAQLEVRQQTLLRQNIADIYYVQSLKLFNKTKDMEWQLAEPAFKCTIF